MCAESGSTSVQRSRVPGGAEDAAAKTAGDQPRQVAAVIEVRVRQHHGVDALGIDRKRRPVPDAQLFQSLKQAAVDEHAVTAEIQQMLRPGDGPCGAEKRQSGHSMTILEVMRRAIRVWCPAAIGILLLWTLAIPIVAQQKRLSIDDIYDPGRRVNFSGVPAPEITWIDGTHFASISGARGSGDWLKVDAAGGASAPLFDASKMEAALVRLTGVNAGEADRAVRSRSVTFNQAHTAAVVQLGDDLYGYSFDEGRAVRLTNAPAPRSRLRSARTARPSRSCAATTCMCPTSRPDTRPR